MGAKPVPDDAYGLAEFVVTVSKEQHQQILEQLTVPIQQHHGGTIIPDPFGNQIKLQYSV